MVNIKSLDKLMEFVGEDALLVEMVEAIEREVSERFMPLPCDAEGVPIHLGDEIQQINHAGEWTNALPVIAVDENGCFATVQALTCEARTYIWGNNCRHYKPRTLEDVLGDAIGEYERAPMDDYDAFQRIAAKYADEIRELMGVEK